MKTVWWGPWARLWLSLLSNEAALGSLQLRDREVRGPGGWAQGMALMVDHGAKAPVAGRPEMPLRAERTVEFIWSYPLFR